MLILYFHSLVYPHLYLRWLIFFFSILIQTSTFDSFSFKDLIVYQFSVTFEATLRAMRMFLTNLLPQGVKLTKGPILHLEIHHLIWSDIPPATVTQVVNEYGNTKPICSWETQDAPDSLIWLEDSTLGLPTEPAEQSRIYLPMVFCIFLSPKSDLHGDLMTLLAFPSWSSLAWFLPFLSHWYCLLQKDLAHSISFSCLFLKRPE